jgi:glycosyltransferase involved in cell wall biosynthesis
MDQTERCRSGIAFFHQNEVDHVQGGIERYISTLLDTCGSEAVLVTEHNGNESKSNRITVPLAGPPRWPKWLRFNLGIIANAGYIRDELKARGIKVLELSRPEYALISWLFPEKKVFTFHGMGPNRKHVGQRLVHDMTALSMPIVANGIQIVGRDDSALPATVMRRVQDRVVHVDAWYDERFTCSPLPPLGDSPLICFYSGRLSEQKNPELLFAVIRESLAKLPVPVEFRYFGDDVGAIKGAGLEGVVRCAGFLDPDRLAAEIGKCHLGLLCSKQEGSPFAMIETLGCGRAFVSSPIDGLMKAYADTRGVFFAERLDCDAFLAAITRARSFLLTNSPEFPVSEIIARGVQERCRGNVARAVINRLQDLAAVPPSRFGAGPGLAAAAGNGN